MSKDSKIEHRCAVEVCQVANGYLVKLPHMMARAEYQPIEASMVFQTFAELVAWMSGHFTHRATSVAVDEA